MSDIEKILKIEIDDYFTDPIDKILLDFIKVDGFPLKQIWDEIEECLDKHVLIDMTDNTYLYLGIRIKQMLKTIIFLYKQFCGEFHPIKKEEEQ